MRFDMNLNVPVQITLDTTNQAPKHVVAAARRKSRNETLAACAAVLTEALRDALATPGAAAAFAKIVGDASPLTASVVFGEGADAVVLTRPVARIVDVPKTDAAAE